MTTCPRYARSASLSFWAWAHGELKTKPQLQKRASLMLRGFRRFRVAMGSLDFRRQGPHPVLVRLGVRPCNLRRTGAKSLFFHEQPSECG